MARFRKTLAKVGRYLARSGPFEITQQRIEHWAEQNRRMQEAGLLVPLPWGHQPKAVPGDEKAREELEYWRGRLNAGYIERLEATPDGEFILYGNAPGLELDETTGCLVDPVTKSAVREMSLACMDFVDGKGRVWQDAIVHAAFTTYPVLPGLHAVNPSTATEPTLFSLSDFVGDTLHRFSLDTLPEILPGDATMAEEKKPEFKGESKDGSKGYDLKKVLEHLREHGIVLPDDTDEENFMERICVACTALKGESGKEPEALPEEPKEIPVSEEQPAMMSLAEMSSKNPLFAGLYARTEKDTKAARESRISKLCKRGLPLTEAARLRQEASLVRLSLTAAGEVEETEVDRKIALLEASLPPEGSFVLSQATGSAVTVETPPEGMTGEQTSRLADQWAKEMGWKQQGASAAKR